MEWTELQQQWQAAMAAKPAYVAALPAWVRLWMGWMSTVLPTCLFLAFWRAEARWTLLALIASEIVSSLIGTLWGWSRLWSLAHLVCWTPLVIYLLRRWPRLEWRPQLAGHALELSALLRTWAALTLGTMSVSLAFDALDVVRYALGAS